MDNVIDWFDIPTIDLKRAAKFYSTILGQEVHIMDYNGATMGFFPMDSRDGVGGALNPPMPGGNQPSADGTRVYLNCNGKLDAVISRVESAGGKITMPKTDIGDPGFIAFILDTEGNKVGLHSWT